MEARVELDKDAHCRALLCCGARQPLRGPIIVKGNQNFSIPRQSGLRRILSNAPQFIVVRGGAYFFLPGLAALRYLARGSYLRNG